MLECLIWLIVAVIIAVIVLLILETAIGALIQLPPPVFVLLRLLVGLLVLLYALDCLFGAGVLHGFHRSY